LNSIRVGLNDMSTITTGPRAAPTADDAQRARLSAFVDGRLPAAEAAELARAAETDAGLRAEIALVRALKRAGVADRAGFDRHAGWKRLETALDQERRGLADRVVRARVPAWGLAAAAAVAAVLGAALHATLTAPHGRSEDGYHLAEGPAAAPWTARVVFAPDAAEADLRAALLAVEAQIVAGPSAIGVYDLSFRSDAARTAGVAALAARGDLVESVGP
jgi:anti-sigma factor RsiW